MSSPLLSISWSPRLSRKGLFYNLFFTFNVVHFAIETFCRLYRTGRGYRDWLGVEFGFERVIIMTSFVIEQYNASGVPDRTSAHVFAFGGAIYLTLLSIPLLAFPRFLVLLVGPTLLVTDDGQEIEDGKPQALRTLNGLELYLGRLLGLSFITLAIILILQTGAIPLTTSLANTSSSERLNSAPYRQPTVFFMTLFFSLIGFGSWNVGLRFVGLSGSGLAAWGLYVFLFAVGHGKLQTKKKSK